MAAEFICDACGKREQAESYGNQSAWFKPRYWYQRSDSDGIQDACSRACIEEIAKRTKKTAVVAPF